MKIFKLAKESLEANSLDTDQVIEDPTVENKPNTNTEQPTDRPEIGRLEVDNVYKESTDLENADELNNLEDVDVALEETATAFNTLSKLNNLVKNNKIDAVAAESIYISINDINSRLGMKITTPSLESYSAATSNQVALETIATSVKTILNKILEMIKRAISWSIKFIEHFNSELLSLTKKVTELLEATKTVNGGMNGNNRTIDMEKYGEIFRYKNTLVSEDHIEKFCTDYLGVMEGFMHDLFGPIRADKVFNHAKDYIEAMSKGFIVNRDKADPVGSRMALKAFLNELPKFKNVKKETSDTIITYMDLGVGDKCFMAEANTQINTAGGVQVNMLYNITIEDSPSKKEINTNKQNAPLDIGEIRRVCDRLLTHFEFHKKFQAKDRMEKLLSDIKNEINSKDFIVEEAVAVNFIIKEILKVFTTLSNKTKDFDMTVCKYMYSYCKDSFNTIETT